MGDKDFDKESQRMSGKKRSAEVALLFVGIESCGTLKAELPVRRLAASLADATAFVLFQKLDCGRRHRFVDVSTRETATVSAVPVSLSDH